MIGYETVDILSTINGHQDLVRLNDEQRQKVQHREPKFRAVDPFQKFKVEIRMEHPFWSVLTAELNAPDLNNENPDTYAYMNAYNQSFGIMQDLADALMELVFSR